MWKGNLPSLSLGKFGKITVVVIKQSVHNDLKSNRQLLFTNFMWQIRAI